MKITLGSHFSSWLDIVDSIPDATSSRSKFLEAMAGQHFSMVSVLSVAMMHSGALAETGVLFYGFNDRYRFGVTITKHKFDDGIVSW